jgi:hypothetical protein
LNGVPKPPQSCDFHLFPKLKEFLGDRRFKSDEEVKDAVKEWLNGLAAEVYDEGILNLVTRYDKCVNVGGDYVKKNLRSVIMIHYIFYFILFLFLYRKTVFSFWTTLVHGATSQKTDIFILADVRT